MPNGTGGARSGDDVIDELLFLMEAMGTRVAALERRVAAIEMPPNWRLEVAHEAQPPSLVPLALGEWIRRIRISRDLTQDELGAILGVDQSTITKWERGARMDLERLGDIARWMRVPVDDLRGAYYRQWGGVE